MKCDDCGREIKEVYDTTVYLKTFDCTITDIHLCKKCFEKNKGGCSC